MDENRMREKSFTLIELLVVFSIIIILTSLTVVFFKPNRERVNLVLSAHQLAQDIRYTEDLALSGKELPSGIPQGYGVHICDISASSFNNQYFIFGDINGDNIYGSGDEIIRSPIFPGKGVEIADVSSSSGCLDVVVIPPDPEIVIEGSPSQAEAKIILWLSSDHSQRVKMTINKKGLIEIE